MKKNAVSPQANGLAATDGMPMADLAVIEQASADVIRSRIFTIRGAQVMLDRDLAELYGVEVGQLNRQVKRNPERFPNDFMFQLSREECSRCQIGTLNVGRGSNIKYLPYAFTENGIAMLSSVLRSPRAIAANIQVMRAFNTMRRTLASLAPLLSRIEATERRQLKQEDAQARNEERFKLILDARQVQHPRHSGEDMTQRGRRQGALALRPRTMARQSVAEHALNFGIIRAVKKTPYHCNLLFRCVYTG